jgi:hypothetical protein
VKKETESLTPQRLLTDLSSKDVIASNNTIADIDRLMISLQAELRAGTGAVTKKPEKQGTEMELSKKKKKKSATESRTKHFQRKIDEMVQFYLKNPGELEKAETELAERISEYESRRSEHSKEVIASAGINFLDENKKSAPQYSRAYRIAKAKEEMAREEEAIVEARARKREEDEKRSQIMLKLHEKGEQKRDQASKNLQSMEWRRRMRPAQKEWISNLHMVKPMSLWIRKMLEARTIRAEAEKREKATETFRTLIVPFLRSKVQAKKATATQIISRQIPRWRTQWRIKKKAHAVTMIASLLRLYKGANRSRNAIHMFVVKVKRCQQIARQYIFKMRTQTMIVDKFFLDFEQELRVNRIQEVCDEMQIALVRMEVDGPPQPEVSKKTSKKEDSAKDAKPMAKVQTASLDGAAKWVDEHETIVMHPTVRERCVRRYLKEAKLRYVDDMEEFVQLCHDIFEKEKQRFFLIQSRNLLRNLVDMETYKRESIPDLTEEGRRELLMPKNLPLWVDAAILEKGYTSFTDLDNDSLWENEYKVQFFAAHNWEDFIVHNRRLLPYEKHMQQNSGWKSALGGKKRTGSNDPQDRSRIFKKPRFRLQPTYQELMDLQVQAIAIQEKERDAMRSSTGM